MSDTWKRLPVSRRILLLVIPLALVITAAVDDTTQRILRGFDLVGMVYRQVLTEYVDDVSPDALLKAGVEGMLSSLDPYAEFIEQRENSEVDALSRGSYGGLGIKVRHRNGVHTISDIYEEIRPLTNLRIGDVILRVDGMSLQDEWITDLRLLLRGAPGTTVRLVIRRPGVSDSLDLVVRRRDVILDPLPYAARFDDGTLYLRISRFTRSSADSVRAVLRAAFDGEPVTGVILDVRDNPGGLLEAAVALVDQFVQPGTPVVSMRGRQPAYARDYRARETAISEHVPLAVLVNGRSASASEIVAGALQDLDRAVILGERTYGKGLVQTLVPLSHNAVLKLTTSRYYIPSGRCIQRIVYSGGKGSDRPMSSTTEPVFHTLRLSRPVAESNGIRPDIPVAPDTLPPALRCIEELDTFFHFVVQYNNRHHLSALPVIDHTMQAEFRLFYDSVAQCTGSTLLTEVAQLEINARRHGMREEAIDALTAFRSEVRRNVIAEFDRSWPLLKQRLELEFASQVIGERERIHVTMRDDKAVRIARSLLTDPAALEAAMLNSSSY